MSGNRMIVDHACAVTTNNVKNTLVCYGISTSVAVAVWDPTKAVGGILHFMLPYSKSLAAGAENQPNLFADTGLPRLYASAYELGASKKNILTYVVGGADLINRDGKGLDLGHSNLHMMRRIFEKSHIDIAAEDTGGRAIRTLTLEVGTGVVTSWVPGNHPRILSESLSPVSDS